MRSKMTNIYDKEGKGLSKIQLLAKARAEKKAAALENSKQNDENKTSSISILDKLKGQQSRSQNRPPLSSRSSSSSSSQSSSIRSSKLSSLASTRSKLGNRPIPSLRQSKPSSKIDLSKPIIPKEDIRIEPKIKEPKTKEPEKPSFVLLDVKFDKSPFNSISNNNISSFIPKFSTSSFDQQPIQQQTYKRKLEEYHLTSIYSPFANESIAKKIKTNFSQPSPDDVILNAQKQAFEENSIAKSKKQEELQLSKDVSNLKITPKQSTKPKFKIDLNQELLKRQEKPHTSFVVIGHVDAGKSTLTGRLLLENNVVDKNTYTKLKREAEKAGKGSFHLAWVMDQTEEERNRGVTVDICTSEFETPNASFTIVDAPGHKDFVPNMITGVSQADIAVLVIDSSTDAFESGFNLDGQTKEHTILARSLGINKIIVAVNKMDNNDWSQDRFEEIRDQLTEFLKITGFQQDQIQFIPCSGLSGVNISQKPSTEDELRKLKWYNGDSLLSALENSEKFSRDFNKPFVMSISDISSNYEFSGRIDTGTIQPGETVLFAPSNQAGIVDSIVIGNNNNNYSNNKTNVAIAGDQVTLKIKDVQIEEIQIGDVISIVTNEISSLSKFESRLVLFDLKRPLLLGTQFVLFRGNVQQPAKITKIISLLDKTTGKITKKNQNI
ncbi:HBS1-like protein [Wickerhamomyces ciferrii]|uniref:Elongation factor 1 alpha-like protein n=1 Tax=Wickerhamomyces ciferrii (strain ATCC 14091 / BCRC 22168 / CBS 111 / JCM 3599 / NBRC 0793 / NRRL Y-1031 F-60-10) TaxID=1206466 RepID=K0KDV1_WICCF|nr:HBS1-like protein [Wickerhamomyces ciferrii]CCH43260.1 HBS1-like protein [Wickerhamomyces ciferrii]